ncbi:MAG TPA: hypothetical protein VEC99_18205 [Clostridia bacterium]|nr:hypothetical protein [Clostridia bacterium]
MEGVLTRSLEVLAVGDCFSLEVSAAVGLVRQCVFFVMRVTPRE